MKRRSLVPGAMLFAAIGIMPQKTGGCAFYVSTQEKLEVFLLFF